MPKSEAPLRQIWHGNCVSPCDRPARAGQYVGIRLHMAHLDRDALTQFETDACQGRVDALFDLGLAYSTGTGAGVDYIAAHKWFNLAAMHGVSEAQIWRAQISQEMSAGQLRRPSGKPANGCRIQASR